MDHPVFTLRLKSNFQQVSLCFPDVVLLQVLLDLLQKLRQWDLLLVVGVGRRRDVEEVVFEK